MLAYYFPWLSLSLGAKYNFLNWEREKDDDDDDDDDVKSGSIIHSRNIITRHTTKKRERTQAAVSQLDW